VVISERLDASSSRSVSKRGVVRIRNRIQIRKIVPNVRHDALLHVYD
jgi:hypothetical protein